jgi:hypothetical protein
MIDNNICKCKAVAYTDHDIIKTRCLLRFD